MSNAALQKALEGVDGYELNSAGNIDINRTVDDDEIAVYKSFWMMTTQQSRLLRTMFLNTRIISRKR